MPKSKAPAQTFEETHYLKRLSEEGKTICVRMISDEEFCGRIEFYDVSFIRLTREDGPNLFIYKDQIKYLYELDAQA